MMRSNITITKAIVSLSIFLHISNATILSTSSRWIVNQYTGERVKLACVNWISHLEPMIAEGLEKKPLHVIAGQIAADGFTCVRFTWPTFMFTRLDYYNLTVSQSLDKYNLSDAKAGILKNNPWSLGLKIQTLHKVVVIVLGQYGLMVILDNHISLPGWCCRIDDKNGFFGDPDFDPDEWLQGLAAVARTYKYTYGVVGMSMRNELRGKDENVEDWYKYMQQGAMTIHQISPQFLVIISGLTFDTNLTFLKEKSLQLSFRNKIVFEAHWYTFIFPTELWTAQTNKFCANVTQSSRDNFLFLTTGSNPYPVFLSEFGLDQRGQNEGQNRYITCLLAEVAEKDIDWALWTFQGSYIYRQGKVNPEEFYGVMNFNWDGNRNQTFLDRLQVIRQKNQEVRSWCSTYYIMFHPQSGLCVQFDKGNNNVFLANCKKASRWAQHQDGGPIVLARTSQCLKMASDGETVRVSYDCSSKWNVVSSIGLQLATRVKDGKYMCLEKNINNSALVTRECLCVDNNLNDLPTCPDNPLVQWFKFVPRNVYNV
ncbi:Cellulase (glycosyl hydrolase family 5) protein [Striga hermonthica]|uniref:Cellulase (Glycosyl hydrolase family 5) protein n=1 Tax=Striga hermonthica TaxID=68872 RepID=A0A9N7N1Q0_STRHE|nr:Cellulase (glycosyl hydrolase family 5) protein [Striga hermonthica]